MGDVDIDIALAARCQRTARLCALAIAGLGAIVLMDWWLDIAVLKALMPGWVNMKANTALGFLLAGIALARPVDSPGGRVTRAVLAATVALLGLMTLAEYVGHVDFGIDQLLFRDLRDSPGARHPGRMAPATAAAFLLTGLTLIALDGRRSFQFAQASALAAGLIGIMSILDHAYGVDAQYGLGTYASMALHTAIGFVVINLAALLSRPRIGLLAVLVSRTAGGMMARRLLPLALIGPFAIGWLLVASLEIELLGAPFAIALASLTYLVLFSAVIWRTARTLRHSDLGRAAAETAQQKQQAQLAGIIDSAMDGIIMIDETQHITSFNRAAEHMFGRQAADVLGGPLDSLIPHRYRAGHAGHVRSFGSNGTSSRRIEGFRAFTGLRANGEEFPIEASISHQDAEGSKVFTVILRDISDRYRAEQALIESRRQLNALIEQAPVSIAMFDRNLNYLATSRHWLANYSEGGAELVGRNHYDVVPDISSYWKKVHRDGLAGIVTRNDADLWVQEDGSSRWLRWVVQPWISELGGVGGIIILAEDITYYKRIEIALRASEDDLKRAQAVGSIGSWRLDMLRNELSWSSEAYRIFGLPDATPLSYDTFLGQVHPEDRDYVDRTWRGALHGEPYDIEHRVLAAGRTIWVREKAELEFDDQQRLIGAFGITQDITGRKKAEQQLKEAHDQLAAVAAERAASLRQLSSDLTLAEQRERDHFYELLHDHVQPLLVAVRLGLSGLGAQTSRDDMLQSVKEAIAQISQVIQAARTLSVELSPPLIRERGLAPALDSLGRWVRSNYGLSVDLRCAPETEPASMTVRLLCFNAVRELLMNVVKHAGVREVELRVERVEADTLKIVVRDHGVGFDPAADRSGSGLANFERRLGMVGGSLSIESMPDRGTTATIRAPLEISPDEPATSSGESGAAHSNAIDGSFI